MASPAVLYQAGNHAGRPANGSGCVLYSCTDHDLVYRDDGTSWTTFMTLVDGSGGDIATDAIWDGAGDLVQGTGANTAARLAIGAAGTMLRSTGSAAAWAVPSQVLIASDIKGSPAAGISFTSIPGTYNHLRLVLVGRSAKVAGDDLVTLKLNSDTGSNYLGQTSEGSGTAESNAQQATAAGVGAASQLGYLTAASATANVPGMIIIDLPLYAGTTFTKIVKSSYAYQFATAGNNRNGEDIVHWASTAAITQIDLQLNGGANFATGTAAYLYGIT